jgi:hypothetical protein
MNPLLARLDMAAHQANAPRAATNAAGRFPARIPNACSQLSLVPVSCTSDGPRLHDDTVAVLRRGYQGVQLQLSEQLSTKVPPALNDGALKVPKDSSAWKRCSSTD